MGPGILDGVRVVDLSWGLAGPVAALLLAESGADVVKVEPPAGDPMRALAGFATWNRSKRSVALDLASPGDRAVLDDLLAGADVLIHSLRPSDARRLGLDDASLSARVPHLIACAVGGYPVDHPDADRPGWDALVQARMGLMDEQRGHRDGPVLIRFPVPSWGAAYLAAAGVLARLVARDRGMPAGPAHTSLLQGALVTLTMHWARAERPTPALSFGLPKDLAASLYQCGDGVWVHLMKPAHDVPLMATTLAELGEERLAEARANDVPSYFGDFAATQLAFRQRPSTEWLPALWEADVPVLPAQSLGDILRDEQAIANGYVVDVDDPEWGPCRQAGIPFHTTPAPAVRGPAARLDEHGDEVRAELRSANLRAHRRNPSVSAQIPESGVGPLGGARVLDFGNYLAGPFAAMLLADLGADVVKVETVTGDPMRGVERVFAGCQRGKRGVAIDLKHPDAREALEAMVRGTDVVHHNLRWPAACKLGIDEPTLRPLCPDLIYCHTSAYGPRGPRADWPGYDQLFQAYAGWEVEGGGEGNPPMWHRMGMMDHQNALASLVAVLLALWHRDRTGEGQFVQASILGASTLTASETLVRADGSLAPFPRLDHAQTALSPGYGIHRCRDGWVAVVARDSSLEQAASVDAASMSCAEAVAAFEGAGADAEIVRLDQSDAFFDDEANRRTRVAVTYEHPVWGAFEQIGALWKLGDMDLRLDRPPPTLGQHTAEVLAECGLDDATIDRLARAGAVVGDGLPAAGT